MLGDVREVLSVHEVRNHGVPLCILHREVGIEFAKHQQLVSAWLVRDGSLDLVIHPAQKVAIGTNISGLIPSNGYNLDDINLLETLATCSW